MSDTKQRSFGFIPSPPDPRDFKFSDIRPGNNNFPKRFIVPDWPVNDQDSYGSCVAQSASGIADWQQSSEWETYLDTSPLFVYSECKRLDGAPDEAGTFPRVAMGVLKNTGICLEKTFPYHLMTDDKNPPKITNQAKIEAENYKAKSYARLYTLDDIKKAILVDGPVLLAFWWFVSMSVTEPGGFVPMPEGFFQGGHAVTGTGWDDDLEHTYERPYKGIKTFKGFLRIRNSWGDTWGDNGYCWIPYAMITDSIELFGTVFSEGWTVVDYIAPGNTKPVPKSKDEETKEETKKFDVPPAIIDGRTMLEVRSLATITGAINIGWEADTKKVTLEYPDRYVYMWIGQNEYKVVPK